MNPKILIVDDDEEISTQMKWGLAKSYEIFLAQDRPSAIEVFQAQRPLLVLLDLGLPPNPADPEEGLATLSDLLSLERLTSAVCHKRHY
jgi:two-component system NtrC family response regulator